MEMAENLASDQENGNGELISKQASRKAKGGIITLPFIIANEALQMVASIGLMPNMVLYLMNEYRMGVKDASNLLFYCSAASNFTPLIGAFVADSYLGRFLCIGLGCITTFLGMVQLWLTAMISSARPAHCHDLLAPEPCESTTAGQYVLLISSFGLVSIGGGGIKPCSLAFGADQIDNKNSPNNATVLERYFGWYYASTVVSVLIAFTGIVYVQDHMGWKVGFGVPAILMFCSTLVFFLASSLYIKHKVHKSLFTRLLQVIAVAYKNRKLDFTSDHAYHREEASAYAFPTDRLRFLNKACIVKNPQDVSLTGVSSNLWDLCTIEQVEELKALIKVIPLWSTGIMVSVNISQSSFPLLQANSMDRHLGRTFQIPAGSFGMFSIIVIAIWVILYDRAIIPLASKITGNKVHVDPKLRMGFGIFFSCLAMLVSGITEHIRKGKAIEQGLLSVPRGVVHMSALWLVPQHCLSGLAEALNIIGQIEFYYSEFPKSMSSIASSLSGVGMGVANLLASLILSYVDKVTRRGGKESWVSNSINKAHYEYYYWLLATLTLINLLYFLVCNWCYGPIGEKVVNTSIDRVELR